jgi:DNA-directed RNA polymerase subunit RPC12/RpoP
MTGRRVENEYGLTFAEWLAAAGGRAHVDAVIQSGTTAQKAWRGGEDPTEYRAADATRIRASKARRRGNSANAADASGPGLSCDMERDCTAPVTHADAKGYVYCERHATQRKSSYGAPRVRKLKPHEVSRLGRGERLHAAGAGATTTKKRIEPVFACMECGRKFRTVGAAQRATNQGCPGCGGSDIDLYVPSEKKRSENMTSTTSSNMAKSKARVRLGKKALSAPTRVATLAELGHRYDPDAFYSVKAGKLHVRHRKVGRGLGKASVLGPVPGFRKGLFYYVARGVVYARSRK